MDKTKSDGSPTGRCSVTAKKSSPCRNHPQGGGVCSSHAAVRPRQSPCSAPGLSSPARWPLGTGAVLVKTAFKMSGHLKIEDKSQECSSLAFGGSAQRGGPSRTRQRAKVWAATSSAVSAAIMLQTSCLCIDSDTILYKLQRGWARPAPVGFSPLRPIGGFAIPWPRLLVTALRRLRTGSLRQKLACSGWRKGHVACGEKHDKREAPRKHWHRNLLNSPFQIRRRRRRAGMMMPALAVGDYWTSVRSLVPLPEHPAGVEEGGPTEAGPVLKVVPPAQQNR